MYRNKTVFAILFFTVMAFALHAQNVYRHYSPDTLLTNGNGDPVLNGGYGSAFAKVPGEAGSFYMLTDRGPNVDGAVSGTKVFPIPAFNPQIGKFTIQNDSLVLQSVINLKRPDGTLITGLPNPTGYGSTGEIGVDLNGNSLGTDTFGIDCESLVALADGTFWISDEYGPHIIHFDANGNEIERINPFGNGTGGRSLPLVFAKRRANRGMEGLTITPDGSTLVGMMQSTMNNPSGSLIVNKKLTRIVTFNIATGTTQQFIYMQEANALANSEIVALTDSTFIVLERDGLFPGNTTSPAVYKRFYKINLNGATDVSDPMNGAFGLMFDGGTKTLEQMTDSALAANGIVPVSKELVLDVLVNLSNYPHDKPEGVVVIDNTTLAICNDDDFGILGDGAGGFISKMLPLNSSVDYNAIYFATVPALLPVNTEVEFAESTGNFKENDGTVYIAIDVTNNGPFSTSFNIETIESTAIENTDYSMAASSFQIPGNVSDTTIQLAITISDNTSNDAAKFFTLELISNDANIGGQNRFIAYILDDDKTAPVATQAISLNHVSSYQVTEGGSAEILAYDAVSQRLFVVNSVDTELAILDFSNPYAISAIDTIDMSVYGAGITSVACLNGVVAVTVDNGPSANGLLAFFNTDGVFQTSVAVGNLPDHVSFTPDGNKLLTANEGQPSNDYLTDPEGTVSVIDISGGLSTLTQSNVTTLNFNAFDAQLAALKNAGVRVFGPNASVSQDFEPEYITYNQNSTKAFVTLQENNAIAVVDLGTLQITDIWPMGYKDHNLPGNEFDGSDKTDTIIFANWPVKGMYMPDALAYYEVAGQGYYVTANEGDSRDYSGYSEETDVASLILDSAAFPNAYTLQSKYGIGRLKTTTSMGDTDNDGDNDEIYVFGGRSFSIYNASTGIQVYDSGDDMELIIASHPVWSALFNASNSNNNYKNRSDDKGPEPETVTIHEVNGIPYAFIALERIGGVMTYDISNPASPVFVDYVNSRDLGADEGGDLGPEGIIFISYNNSPIDTSLVVVANEVSGTVSVFSVIGETYPTPADTTVNIVVFSDPHYMDPALLINDGTAFQTYLAMDRKMLKESEAILEAMVDTILAMNPDVVLVPGDLTKDGEKSSHEGFAAYLQTLEDNGIKVFVAPGNHDINNPHAMAFDGASAIPVDHVSPAQFDSIYANFGFDEAIDTDPNSLSYLVEPYPGFQIISIDVCKYENNIATNYPETAGEMPWDTYQWVASKIQAAIASGKYIVGMMHHNLTEHSQGQSVMFPEYVIAGWDTLAGNFADMGLKAMFTGHYHAQDMVQAISPAGNEIYDIETGSLLTWPSPFRTVAIDTLSGDISISTGLIENIDYNTGGLSFQDYAHNFISAGFPLLVNYMLTQPPYSLDPMTASSIEPAITETFLAHYHGNEGDPSPMSQAIINNILASPMASIGYAMMAIWNDPAPDDWNHSFNLNFNPPQPASFALTILHNNDGESKLINAGQGMENYGGVARFKTVLENLRDEANTTGYEYITLSSGDNFLAGPQFNAGLYNPNGLIYDAIAIDSMKYDALCLGNHDFDFGPAVLADFINDIQVNPSTYLSANLNFANEPALSPLAANGKITDRKIVVKEGRKIGIIGLTTPMLGNISSPGNTIIEFNVDSVVQAEVNHLKTVDSVNIIILISHMQDLQADTMLIQNLHDVDVVIAGGGDEVLGSPGDLLVPVDSVKGFSGTYPLEFADADGETVYVVTTPGEYRYVGNLMLNFDEDGKITYVDPASSMVLVDNTVTPNAGLQSNVVEPVQAYINGLALNVIATSEVDLDGIKAHVREFETNEGNLAADAMLWQAQQLASNFGANMPNVSLQNGGGIRNNNIIAAGNFTELNTWDILSFDNFVTVVEDVTPTLFKEVLENCVSAQFNGANIGNGRFAQVGGFKFEYDTAAQSLAYDLSGNLLQQGERIWKVTLDNGTPIVWEGQVVPGAPNLNIAIVNFSAKGGDQYPLANNNMVTLGATYQQALFNYVVNGLNGLITAVDYPEGGEGRITYKTLEIPAPWTYTTSADDHTILLPVNTVVNGMTLEAGDYLGVFYYANGHAECGGYIQWDGNATALSAWGADLGNDGFATGEDFKWRIYDASAGIEYQTMATYDNVNFTETGFYANNGISGIISLDVVEDSQFVLLPQGWGIISTYIDPIDPNAEVVFADVVANNALIMLKDEIGNVYWPAYNLNLLGDLTIGEGYKVKTSSLYLLEVVGQMVIPETTPVSLDAGWSLFGYLRTSPAPIVDLLSTVSSSIRLVKNPMGLIYWPAYGVDQIINMYPGQGYKTNMYSAATLYYAPNTLSTKALVENVPQTENYVCETGAEKDMTLLIPGSAWSSMPNLDDEIGIFSERGKLVGSSVFTGSNTALTIWGGSDLQNMADGESFVIKVWSKTDGSEKVMEDIEFEEGSNSFIENSIAIVKSLSTTEESAFAVYPNPAHENLIVPVSLNNNGDVSIEIFDVASKLVQTIQYTDLNEGNSELEINVVALSNGTYSIQVRTSQATSTQKLVIMK
ncbi:MAG: choice-of-anchor I family protein [Bacteroidales bacterium]|nr:choice-of-anchor I family protein [Bacteroidales bacterium]MCF8455723.1 choice-of-anchor I family protein [Bacteroidales bacterium]